MNTPLTLYWNDRATIACLVCLVVALSGCAASAPVLAKNDAAQPTLAERESVLSAKIQCITEGRKFFDREEKSREPGENWFAKYAYSPELNTCLCEEIMTNKTNRSKVIYDVLTEQILASYENGGYKKMSPDERAEVAEYDTVERHLFPQADLNVLGLTK